MKKRSIHFLIVLYLGVPGTALAESNFDGIYAGFAAGVVSGVDKGREFKDYGASEFDTVQRTNPQGGLFSPFVGFNHVMHQNILLGIEADYERRSGSDISLQEIGGVPASPYPIKTRVIDAASLRARLGHVFNEDHTLLYVTGGYTTMSVKRSYGDEANSGGIGTSINITARHGGYTAGFGMEHFLTDKISVRGEYRYAHYFDKALDTSLIYGAGTIEKQLPYDQSLRVGLAYNF